MKNLLMGTALLLAVASINAQGLTLPQASPRASVMQEIGIARVTIEYGSPAVGGREVWGKLVPYGMSPGQTFNDGNPYPWRAGANVNTVFTTTHEIMVEGKVLPAGSYGLHMIPSEKEWIVIFNKNSTAWGSFFYRESEDALRVTVSPKWETESQDRLSYGFRATTTNSSEAYLRWEKIRIPLQITIDEAKLVLTGIRSQLRTALAFNVQALVTGANQCLKYNQGLDDAIIWLDRAVSQGGGATVLFTKSAVLDKMGKTKEAADLKKSALESGTEADLNNYGYQLLGRKAVDEAIEVFEANVKRFPKSWNVFDSLGEALATKGDKKKAIENYQKAMNMAPEGQKPRIGQIIDDLKKS